jgi:hypothetical protein
MDLFDILIAAAISIVCVAFLAGEKTESVLDTFGAGFLPYRKDGWPRGVQEGEPVPWKWSAMADRSVSPVEREPAPGTPAEIFEIDSDDDVALTGIERGSVGPGGSLRQ